MEEISVNATDRPWEPAKEYRGKASRKVLRVGADGRPRVALLKLEPGFEMDAHSHDLAENHYVLQGMYESHGREYPAGSFRFVPPNTRHGPFRSAGGALLLVFWSA